MEWGGFHIGENTGRTWRESDESGNCTEWSIYCNECIWSNMEAVCIWRLDEERAKETKQHKRRKQKEKMQRKREHQISSCAIHTIFIVLQGEKESEKKKQKERDRERARLWGVNQIVCLLLLFLLELLSIHSKCPINQLLQTNTPFSFPCVPFPSLWSSCTLGLSCADFSSSSVSLELGSRSRSLRIRWQRKLPNFLIFLFFFFHIFLITRCTDSRSVPLFQLK